MPWILNYGPFYIVIQPFPNVWKVYYIFIIKNPLNLVKLVVLFFRYAMMIPYNIYIFMCSSIKSIVTLGPLFLIGGSLSKWMWFWLVESILDSATEWKKCLFNNQSLYVYTSSKMVSLCWQQGDCVSQIPCVCAFGDQYSKDYIPIQSNA